MHTVRLSALYTSRSWVHWVFLDLFVAFIFMLTYLIMQPWFSSDRHLKLLCESSDLLVERNAMKPHTRSQTASLTGCVANKLTAPGPAALFPSSKIVSRWEVQLLLTGAVSDLVFVDFPAFSFTTTLCFVTVLLSADMPSNYFELSVCLCINSVQLCLNSPGLNTIMC